MSSQQIAPRCLDPLDRSGDAGQPSFSGTGINGPLNGNKSELLEGGIHVPFFIQWKGHLPAGAVYHQAISSLDIHATALALAGGEPPRDKPLDGVNLIPYLTGEQSPSAAPHEFLFWRYGDNFAVRHGRWKLLKTTKSTSLLYDLQADLGETRNLADQYPEVVTQLEQKLAEWNAQLVAPLWGVQGGTLGPRTASPQIDFIYELTSNPAFEVD